jgi:hypothetical protein
MAMKMKRKHRKGNIDQERENTSHPTIQKANKAKVEVLDEYWNFDSMRLLPMTKATILRLAENGIKWAKDNEKAYKVEQFLVEQGINLRTWQRWCEQHEELQNAHDQMVMIIGCRRESGLLERRFDSQSTMFMMPHYDGNWKKNLEWKTGLTNKTEGVGGTQFVVIPACPNSPLVPEKKE